MLVLDRRHHISLLLLCLQGVYLDCELALLLGELFNLAHNQIGFVAEALYLGRLDELGNDCLTLLNSHRLCSVAQYHQLRKPVVSGL